MTHGLPAQSNPDPYGDGPPHIDVGEFRQGSPLSQWALARYLVGRALVESVGWSLMALAVVLVGLGALLWFGVGAKVMATLLVIIAVGVLLMRWVLLSVVRRLTGFTEYGPLAERMRALVDDTSTDVLRELRRIGLPSHIVTLPLLALRFLGRERRSDTVARLKQFEVERAVPKARLDELHLTLRSALDRTGGPAVPPTP